MSLRTVAAFAFLVTVSLVAAAEDASEPAAPTEPRLRVDHLPVAVRDLDVAASTFGDQLGFRIKPGRLHDDSIDNLHLKFADGSGIELITATEPKSSLARSYLDFLRGGDGGAFVALSGLGDDRIEPWQPRLESLGFEARLHRGAIGQWITFAGNPELRSIFLFGLHRRPVDRPEVLNHPNGVQGIDAVWVEAPADGALVHLLIALGARRKGILPSPWDGRSAEHFELQGNRILRLDPSPGTQSDRPIIGVSFRVVDLDRTLAAVSTAANRSGEGRDGKGCGLWLPKERAHGLILEFLPPNCRR